jgi:hypothetical protein
MSKRKRQFVEASLPAGSSWWRSDQMYDGIPECCGTSGTFHSMSMNGDDGDPVSLIETNLGAVFTTDELTSKP